MNWKHTEDLEKVLKDLSENECKDSDKSTIWYGEITLKAGSQNYLPSRIVICSVCEDASLFIDGLSINSKNLDFLNPVVLSPNLDVQLFKNGEEVEELVVTAGYGYSLNVLINNNNILCELANLVYNKDGYYVPLENIDYECYYKRIYSAKRIWRHNHAPQYMVDQFHENINMFSRLGAIIHLVAGFHA